MSSSPSAPSTRVANRVHERIGVRMAVEAFRVRDLDAAEDEFASRDQRVNVIADANVNHGGKSTAKQRADQVISGVAFPSP